MLHLYYKLSEFEGNIVLELANQSNQLGLDKPLTTEFEQALNDRGFFEMMESCFECSEPLPKDLSNELRTLALEYNYEMEEGNW